MIIKKLMDFLNSDSKEAAGELDENHDQENIIYIDNARLEAATEQSNRKEILCTGTQWSDRTMGDLLVDLGKLDAEAVNEILDHQREKGLYFGEAAVDLKLVDQEDILHALSIQFGYTFDKNKGGLSNEITMAYEPFGEQAEVFRSIRSQLLNNWLRPDQNILAVVSPAKSEGRSYVAANLAMAFSQLGRPTLLIDADMRSPRQHEMFEFGRSLGLSMMLAGRGRIEDLDMLPEQLSGFQYLSILGCGAVPPNPSELLSKNTFSLILRELKRYFDIIIIDTPSATNYKADVISIATAAGSALMVAKRGCSKLEEMKNLTSMLDKSRITVVGAILNQF